MAKKENVNFDTELAKFTPKQLEATAWLAHEKVKFLLYGGAGGGGKSRWLRWYCLRRLIQLYNEQKLTKAVAMLGCEDYPALLDRQLQKIGVEWGEEFGKMYEDHKLYRRCYILNKEFGSGVITFRNLDDPAKYHSAEFALIAIDELTMNKYEVFNELRFRLRWPGLKDHQCQFIAASNPGGIGHGWCKQLWIDRLYPDELKKWAHLFKYIPAKAVDNPYLDESYNEMLSSLPENMRKAYKDGSWDVFTGQAFTEFNPVSHVISHHDIPKNAPLYMTFDWGFGAPFSTGWWYVDNDGRLIRCGEWYGWNGTPNTGMRLADSEIAQGIRVREEQMGIWGQNIIRLAGPDCFQKRPDYRGGGQGPSTAEVFAASGIYIAPGDPSRKLKIRQFRERLMRKINDRPMLQVFDTCEHFIRTIPSLVTNRHKIEDIDTTGEDHIFDESSHAAMARPLAAKDEPSRLSETDRRLQTLERPYHGDAFARNILEATSQDGQALDNQLYDYETGNANEPDYHYDLTPF